jgi:hypothetical protein
LMEKGPKQHVDVLLWQIRRRGCASGVLLSAPLTIVGLRGSCEDRTGLHRTPEVQASRAETLEASGRAYKPEGQESAHSSTQT